MDKIKIIETLNTLDEALDSYVKWIMNIDRDNSLEIAKDVSDKIWKAKDILNSMLYGEAFNKGA